MDRDTAEIIVDARKTVRNWTLSITVVILVFTTLSMWGCPAYDRYQTRMNADNQVAVNEIQIHQTEQLVTVEKQKAQIRVEEANGIAASQKIINATLTDRYLQHEAIQAQLKMAGSPNHTQIYIPVGTNGIPLVKTIE
jgi:type IV pilus biogenesis protein CpaD/CtpE